MATTMSLDAVLAFLENTVGLARVPGMEPFGAGLVFIALGLAFCFAGYLLFRLFLAFLGAAALGGAMAGAVLFLGGDSPGGAVLITGAGGALLGFLLSWFFYRGIVFLSGAVVGTILGLVFLLFSGGGPLRESHPAILAVVAGVPALTLGVLYLREERVIVTVTAALLGAMLIALGVRALDVGTPETAAGVAAIAFGLAMLLHFYGQPDQLKVRTGRGKRRSAHSPARRR